MIENQNKQSQRKSNPKVNPKVKSMLNQKTYEINPWQTLDKYDDYKLLESLGNTTIDIHDSKYKLKDLLDCDWIKKHSDRSYAWSNQTSWCSSQQDVIRIENMMTLIDDKIIYMDYFNFGTATNSCDIDRICCYEMSLIL